MGLQARIPPRTWQQVAESRFHSAATSVLFAQDTDNLGVFASRHASKGLHLPAQAVRARPCWEWWGGLLHRGLCLPSSESDP